MSDEEIRRWEALHERFPLIVEELAGDGWSLEEVEACISDRTRSSPGRDPCHPDAPRPRLQVTAWAPAETPGPAPRVDDWRRQRDHAREIKLAANAAAANAKAVHTGQRQASQAQPHSKPTVSSRESQRT